MNNLNLSSIRPNVSQQKQISFKGFPKTPTQIPQKELFDLCSIKLPETVCSIHFGDKLGAINKMLSESIRIIFECMSNFPKK